MRASGPGFCRCDEASLRLLYLDTVLLENSQWHLSNLFLVETNLSIIGGGECASKMTNGRDASGLNERANQQWLIYVTHSHAMSHEID